MNALQIASAVLAKAALFDQTFAKPDAGIAAAWADAIGERSLTDCLTAVTAHYAAETRRLLPADVINGVRRIRADRISRDSHRLVPLTNPDDVLAYQREVRELTRQLGDGTYEPPPLQAITVDKETMTKMLDAALAHRKQASA